MLVIQARCNASLICEDCFYDEKWVKTTRFLFLSLVYKCQARLLKVILGGTRQGKRVQMCR